MDPNNQSDLILYDPRVLLTTLSFLSPIIVVVVVMSWSLLFGNKKGLVYMGWLLAFCALRHFTLFITKAQEVAGCNKIKYVSLRNATFSTFVFAFTIVYMLTPMIKHGEPNVFLIIVASAFFVGDLVVKMKNCAVPWQPILQDFTWGSIAAFIAMGVLIGAGSFTKLAFFNEMSSTKEVCSVAKKQTFKCQVRKNGELVT
jgi:hypothetical protein